MITTFTLQQILIVMYALLAFICFTNPAGVNIKANRWLSLLFIGVAFLSLHGILTYQHNAGLLTGFSEIVIFAMSPALYLAIVRFTSPVDRLGYKYLLLFIPFLFLLLIIMGPRVLGSPFNFPHWLNLILATLMVTYNKLHLPVYWILSMRKLSRHQKNIKLIASDTKPIDLQWLKMTLICLGLMILVQTAFGYFKSINRFEIYAYLFYLAGTLCLVYYLLGQREIYPFETPALSDIDRMINEPRDLPVAAKPRLTDNERISLRTKLERLMNQEQLFLDSELSLPQLAVEMQVTTHDLSWLLNNEYRMNFFQYINHHRVNEAKRLLLSEQHRHLNIIGIAYSAGFNSKTTFNTVFKKETGLSPSRFTLQQQQIGADISIRTSE